MHLICAKRLDPHVIHTASAQQLSSQEHDMGIISPDCTIICELDDKLVTEV